MVMVANVVRDDPVLRSRLKGVGVLSHDDAVAYCATGPTSRASGVPWDVRRDEPTDAYDLVDFEVIVLQNGDVYDKMVLRVLEVIESVKIIRQCLEKLKTVQGSILNNVKEISPGEGIGIYEAPRGEVFHYIRSDGTNRPIRHKVRAPSFVNIPTYTVSCKGIPVADALITLASVDPCYCCTERSLKVVNKENDPCSIDLLKISREKTERIRREINGSK
ncbi:MAG: NADH:ubiquinone oxidoreductase, partial [Candidatus Marinimicrobia bacterium]|nr:NADH:ubiquinone oxidoreductase [Candidatus Neomarinimicrobiota bacterium]